MSGSNGYFSLADLDRIPRLEEDIEIEGMGKFRVGALDQETLRRIVEATRVQRSVPDGKGGTRVEAETDGNLERQYYVAYGLVSPDLGADADIGAALEKVRILGRNVVALGQLFLRIYQLTFRNPGDAYKDLFGVAASPVSEAAIPSTSSS